MPDYMDVTTNAAVIPTIIAAETLGALASNMMLLGIVNRDYDTELASYGDRVTVGVRGALSANDKTAGSNVTIQDPTTTGKTVILDKHKEVTWGEEDIAIMQSRPSLMSDYAEDAALALLEQIEADIAALYSGFAQTIDATSAFNKSKFKEAQRLMNAAKVPLANRWAVLHEDAYADATDITELVHADYQGPAAFEAVQNGLLGRLNGFNVVLDQNVAVAATECKNLFMHRNAAALVTRPMRQTDRQNVEQVVMSEHNIALRVTSSYNADALAEQMTIDVLYGVAELRDNHGIVMRTTEA
ncbi:MAG: P22 phage major capsid protein family protein [Chloroflexota bacterium]